MTLQERRRRQSQARLEALQRPDKWYLSAGDGFLWAPPFPRWLHKPGFWDEGHVYHYPMAPLYSVALVRKDGLSEALHHQASDWRPDRLVVRWQSASGLVLTEFRYVLPGGRFCSAWRTEEELGWPNPAFRDRWLVAFSASPDGISGDVARSDMAISWRRSLEDRRGRTLDVDARLRMAFLPPRGHASPATEMERLAQAAEDVCCGAMRSEGAAHPEWDHTPFVECWSPPGGGFTGALAAPRGVSERGWLHLGLAMPLGGLPARWGVGFTLEVRPLLEADDSESTPVAMDAEPPMPRLSAEAWEDVFSGYPRFTCSDAHLTRYFDYRIYGLHLNRVNGGRGRIRHAAVAEGIEYFHLPITYSAQCHMMETRWSSDPGVARGSLLNFLENQRDDGSLPGRIYVNHDVDSDFYHANWGDAVLAVHAVHPDPDFLSEAYQGLSRYVRWMLRERDPGATGMITVVNHYETGQEYMSRYTAVDPDSDVNEWEPRLRLKGVDVTVYAYQLLRALEEMAHLLDRPDDTAEWSAAAQRTAAALLEEMWDPDSGIFSDVDGDTGRRTGIKAAVCFYPLLTDLLSDAHVEALLAHLQDPRAFATPFPLPSSSVDDPFYSAEGLWKGKRHNCPWNGRVWPMTNSHVLEGLLRQWQRGRRAVGPVAARMLERFVHMMFHDGDLSRPNCYEHYNPETGHACTFRGIDDYQHSWVLDLLIRGVAGIQPHAGGLRIDPLPMGLDDVAFQGVVRGREVEVRMSGGELAVTVDGELREGSGPGAALEVGW